MKLIGIIGHAGAGKDTFAEELHFYSYVQFAFADTLKEACSSLFGISLSSFYDRNIKEEEDPYWGVSPREIAQFVGTELIRENMHKLIPNIKDNFWIESLKYKLYILKQKIESNNQEFKAVITDCRFKNEVSFILAMGGHIIYLTRPEADGTVGIRSHPSEQFIKEFPNVYPQEGRVHYISNDRSIVDLRMKAKKFAEYLESL